MSDFDAVTGQEITATPLQAVGGDAPMPGNTTAFTPDMPGIMHPPASSDPAFFDTDKGISG